MDRRFIHLRLLVILVWPLSLGAMAEDSPRYTVEVSPDIDRLRITACFPGTRPRALVAQDKRAGRYLKAVLAQDHIGERRLAQLRGRIVLGGLGRDGCVEYVIAAGAAVGDSRRSLAVQARNALLLSPHLFVWYPSSGSVDLEVRFELPAGLQVSAPWQRTGGTQQAPIYRIGSRPASWDARIAIGSFRTERIRLPGGTLDVALLDADPPADARQVLRWLRSHGGAVTKAYGRLPVQRLQVLVVPLGAGGEPVPWGEVMRGGGDAVHLYIDQTQSEQAFMQDWVLVHELSHLLHPLIDGDGRWLYEGLASYYQNVLRARQGLLPARTAWEKLHAGFRRGIKGTRPLQTLARASETMLRERAFMRVYWSGAAIALLADLELRQRSGGRHSLDTLLEDLRRCCLPSDRQWGDREVIDKLDALSGARIFRRLYDRHIHSDAFPVLNDAYQALGLAPTSDMTLNVGGGRAAADLRRSIMGAD